MVRDSLSLLIYWLRMHGVLSKLELRFCSFDLYSLLTLHDAQLTTLLSASMKSSMHAR